MKIKGVDIVVNRKIQTRQFESFGMSLNAHVEFEDGEELILAKEMKRIKAKVIKTITFEEAE